MLVEKENMKAVTLQVAQENKTGESFWILLDNNRSKIKIEAIYVPQENVTSNNQIKIMYNNVRKQIWIVQEKWKQVLILGDFNAKVVTYIEGNKETMTKRERQLMKVTKNYDFVIVNKEKVVWKGLWNRVQGQERSILDDVLTNSKLLSTISEMI